MDPARRTRARAGVERRIARRSPGIIGVHVWGRPCQIDALEAIAREHSLSLLFDAAHAFGASYKGRMIGGFGAADEVTGLDDTSYCRVDLGLRRPVLALDVDPGDPVRTNQ